MKIWLLIASCLTLSLPAVIEAQPSTGTTRPAPTDQGRPGQPGGPNKPGAGGPNRPGPGGPSKPGNGGPNRPNPGGPNRPNPGGPNKPYPGAPNRPGIPAYPVRPTPSRPHWGWNGHRYRGPAYRYPAGWAYRRWVFGQTLPLLFLSPAYYFNNWAMLGIQPPPPGYRWVRFGPDLLLVDSHTRYIAYVIHNVFY